MAITVTINKLDKTLKRKIVNADVAMDNSYPTNGESLTPAQLGLTTIDFMEIDGGNGYRPQYDYTNSKIKFYTSAGTETSNTTDLSAITLKIRAIGR